MECQHRVCEEYWKDRKKGITATRCCICGKDVPALGDEIRESIKNLPVVSMPKEPGDWDYYTPAAYDSRNFITAKSAERYQRILETQKPCKRCGQREIDGAMFTDGGGDICDDCL